MCPCVCGVFQSGSLGLTGLGRSRYEGVDEVDGKDPHELVLYSACFKSTFSSFLILYSSCFKSTFFSIQDKIMCLF